jgi:hypothetical protein
LVDLDISKGLFESIDLVLEGKRYVQLLDYVNIPFRCSKCHLYGHVMKDCSKPFFKKIYGGGRRIFREPLLRRKGHLSLEEIVDQKWLLTGYSCTLQ